MLNIIKFRRIIALMLSLIIMPALLAGCGQNGAGSQPDRSGMFVQTTLNPFPEGDFSATIASTKNGSVMAYGLETQSHPRAFISFDMERWQEIDNTVAQTTTAELVAQGYSVSPVVTDDATWWLIASAFGMGEPRPPRLYQIKDDKATELEIGTDIELLNAYRTLPLQDGVAVMFAEDFSNENALAHWFVFDNTGQKKCEFSIGLQSAFSYNAIAQGESLYVPLRESGRLAEYSLETGEQVSTRSIPNLDFNENVLFDIADNGDFCYVTRTGIHRQAEDSGLVQDMVTGTQFVFAAGGYMGTSFLALPDGSYLISAYSNSSSGIYHISFDENASLQNYTQLSIWALEETHLLRAGVSLYREQNPDVYIDVEYGRALGDDSRTNGDILRALNTRIVAGDVPDILVLDGLPADTYMNQGILLDLKGKIDITGCYDNIMDSFTREDKTYAYPALYKMPVLVCQPDDPIIGETVTLERLAELAEQPDNLYYLEMFEVLYTAYSPQVFPDASSVDEEALRNFLVNTKSISDSIGLTNEIEYLHGGMSNEGIYPRQGISKYMEGGTEYAADILWETVQMLLLFQSGDKEFLPLPGGSFLPVCAMAVTDGTENEADALDFIQTMLTDPEVQSLRMEQGFSVVKGMHLPYYESRSADMQGSPEKYDWDRLAESFTSPAITEAVLMDKLYEQAVLYYEGEITLDQAVEDVLKNTSLYFEERK